MTDNIAYIIFFHIFKSTIKTEIITALCVLTVVSHVSKTVE